MAQLTFKGNPVSIVGELPREGDVAPDFMLTKTDLSEITLKDLAGKRVILNIFLSLDTEVCAMSVRRFNAMASNLSNAVVLCVSMDLPFAQARFCGAEGLQNVVPVSDFRTGDFGLNYGVRITEGPLRGLLARAVVIINEEGKVTYRELVPELTHEPDYDAALKALA
ncbi:MAG: thiol peroxidase [Deltaproteobacteria bacterium]